MGEAGLVLGSYIVRREKRLLLWIAWGQPPGKFVCKQEAEAPGGQWRLAVLFR